MPRISADITRASMPPVDIRGIHPGYPQISVALAQFSYRVSFHDECSKKLSTHG